MKRSGIKFITMIVIAMMLTAIATGCGKNDKGNSSAEQTEMAETKAAATQTAEETAKSLDEVTLKFVFGGDKRAAADEVWNTIGEKYKDQLNAKFETISIPFSDFSSKMLVMSASGDKWDLNFDADWLGFYQMSSKGAYLPLNDLLPKYAPTLYAKYQEMNLLPSVTVNGKILGLPWTMAQNTRPYFTWRADLAEKAGLNVPNDSIKTVEDVVKLLRDLKTAYPDMRIWQGGIGGYVYQKYGLFDIGNGYVIDVNDPQVKVIPKEQTQAFLEAAQINKQLYDEGILPKDAMVDKSDFGRLYSEGKIAAMGYTHEFVSGGSFQDETQKLGYSMTYPDVKWFNRTPLANLVAINKNAANPERVLMFLDLLEKDQALYDMVQYGIEGKTYVLDGKAAVYPEGMDGSTSNYMEWGGQWALWKPQFMRPTPQYGEGFWQREAEFAQLPVNVQSPLDGLFLSTDNVKNEMAKRNQIFDEFGRPLDFGITKDVNTSVNEYIEKQKAAGVDKITAEFQKQIDAFLSSK